MTTAGAIARDVRQRYAYAVATLRGDYRWWSFYCSSDGIIWGTYLGVGPESFVKGRSAQEVRSAVERAETWRSSELAKLRNDFPGLRIWMSESGRHYAMSSGPRTGERLIPVLESDSAARLREIITRHDTAT